MGSHSPSKLPVIDFSKPDLKPGTDQWDLVKVQVQQALQEFGCFQALFNKIPLEIQEKIFSVLEELFDLPYETKSRNVSNIPYHGYIGQHPKIPLFESLGFDNPHVIESIEVHTRTFWPQGNSNFSETIQSYAKGLRELEQMIRRMIVEIFQLEKYLDEHMESSACLLKVLKYEAPKTSELQVGLQPHIDLDLLNILYQNDVTGLALQNNSTGEWMDCIPSKDTFFVLIGDSLHAWLNGRLNATYHRVMMRGDKPRYSVGLFSVPKAGYMIKAPEELVDEEHPLLYNPFDYTKLFSLRYGASNEGRNAQLSLKDYCGVQN